MVTLPLKSSHNEQCAVIVLLWAKRFNVNKIHSEMHLVYGDKCFTKQTVHIWCKNARWAEICIIYQGAISCSSVAWTAASVVFFALGIQKFANR